MEILAADGMSTDGTREIVAAMSFEDGRIYLIDNPGKIVPTGMNAALRQAKGEIIVRVDGHCVIAPDYARKCVKYLQVGDVQGVGGPMVTTGETPLSETIAISMASIFGVGGSAFCTVSGKTMFADSVPFPAYPLNIVAKVGLYDEELVRNQDDEYNYRIREFGGKLLLAEDIHSTYASRGSLAKLWKQYYQYGFWKVRVLQKHPRQMSLRQFVPPAFVTALIGSLGLALLASWGWIVFVLVVGSYLLANLAASVVAASHKGWQHLPLLPVCFAILHVSYGAGFWVGLVKFWNRWGDKKGKVSDWKPNVV